MFEVIKGASLAFVLRGLGAGLAFTLNIVIARLLGADGAGLYFLALSVAMIGSVIARMGLDNCLLRFIASSASQGDWGRIKGVHALAMNTAFMATLAVSMGCFVAAPLIAENVFLKPELTEPLRWMSLGILTFSFMLLLSESLKGLKRIRNSMLVSGVIYPFLGIIVIWPMVKVWGVVGASLTYVLVTGVAALIGLMFWRSEVRLHDVVATRFPRDELWASSRPLWMTAIIIRAVLPWAPLFLLGIWGTAEETGIFGAATRVAMLVTFFLVAINTILAPKFAELYVSRDIDTLGVLARRFALLITIATGPVFFLLIFAGGSVMRLFGEDFARGGTVLAVLATGQAVTALTGSAGSLLAMTGYEKDVRTMAIFTMFVMFATALTLIPNMGMLGAAISTAAAVGSGNILAAYLVSKRLGVIIIPFLQHLKVSH